MICAPSNAAIDEIILKILKRGLIGSNGETVVPRMVRVGVLDHTDNE